MRLTTLAALLLAGFSFCQPCLAATDADPACIAEIKAILQASVNSGPFRLVYKQENTPDGVDLVTQMEVVPPNTFHSVGMLDGKPTEMTVVNGKGFLKVGDTWTTLPPEKAAVMTAVFAPETIEPLLSPDVESAGCGTTTMAYGKPVLYYTVITSTVGPATMITMLVDPETRLPVEISNYPNDGGAPAGIFAINLYTYDPTITIKAPL